MVRKYVRAALMGTLLVMFSVVGVTATWAEKQNSGSGGRSGSGTKTTVDDHQNGGAAGHEAAVRHAHPVEHDASHPQSFQNKQGEKRRPGGQHHGTTWWRPEHYNVWWQPYCTAMNPPPPPPAPPTGDAGQTDSSGASAGDNGKTDNNSPPADDAPSTDNNIPAPGDTPQTGENTTTPSGSAQSDDNSPPAPGITQSDGNAAPVDAGQTQNSGAAGAAPDNASRQHQQRRIDLYPQAQAAFQTADYHKALNLIGQSLQSNSQNVRCHQLGVFALMALGRYEAAAAAAHSAAALSDIPTWPTVTQFYGGHIGQYTSDLRALEAFVRQHPNAGEGHFLLGFNYVVTGHKADAKPQFAEAIRLVPGDPLAAKLMQQLGGAAANVGQATPESATQPGATVRRGRGVLTR
jgi:TolA-binding protein